MTNHSDREEEERGERGKEKERGGDQIVNEYAERYAKRIRRWKAQKADALSVVKVTLTHSGRNPKGETKDRGREKK